MKLAVAAALLGWVLTKVHWSDYVVSTADGTSYAVVDRLPDRPGEIRVRTGRLWHAEDRVMPVGAFQPLPGCREADTAEAVVRSGFAATIARMNVPLLLLAVAGFLLQLLIVGARWWFLLRIQDIRIRLWEVIRLTFLGLFFNAVVPGTVGGDLVKAWYVAKHTPKKAAVLVSIFVDRLLGLTELTLMATAMLAVVLLARIEPFAAVRQPAVTVGIVLAVAAFTLCFLLSRRFRGVLHLQKLYRRLPIAHHIDAAGDAATLYRRRIGQLIKAVLITIGAHVLFVGSIALLGLSLHLDTPAYNFFIYVPLVYILGAVPLTPGGVGLVESLYVAFFASATVHASEVLALALLARLIPVLWSLPGAVVAVTGPKRPKVEQIQAELEMETAPAPNVAPGSPP